MRYTGAERILVFEGKHQVGWVTFAELTSFIYESEDAGTIRVHKLNFEACADFCVDCTEWGFAVCQADHEVCEGGDEEAGAGGS